MQSLDPIEIRAHRPGGLPFNIERTLVHRSIHAPILPNDGLECATPVSAPGRDSDFAVGTKNGLSAVIALRANGSCRRTC